MRFSLTLPFLALWLALTQAALRGDTTFYGGRTEYILVTTPKTWDLAQADAVARGGNLAKIDNAAENTLILSKVSGKVTTTASDGGGTVYVWIGGRETATEGTYAWASDNATFWSGGKTGAVSGGLYANWGRTTQGAAGPEPDNFAGTQNRTGLALGRWPSTAASDALAIGTAGQWNDLNGSNALPYVIERPITKPSEGIFATFTMTHGGRPAGSFTCQLFYDKAPITVANFIGLAEGTRPFVDEKSGKIELRPYYNGLVCHRIIPGFMIQGGDARGDGSGGPGYRFADEFDPELRHDHFGTLSMANSGANTNGSQFFVTVSEPSHLNDKHSIFGHVVSGYESVIQTLGAVPTTGTLGTPPDNPLEEVAIQSVTIERLGSAALAFNPAVHNATPVLSYHPVKPELDTSGHLLLKWDEPANASYALFSSPDLKTWSGEILTYMGVNSTVANQVLDTSEFSPANSGKYFFNLVKTVQPVLPPPGLLKKRILMNGTTRGLAFNLNFTTATGGTHLLEQASSSFSLSSTLTNGVWTVTRWDTATFTSDINPPVVAGPDNLTHSDWTFTFRSVRGVFTGGSFTGALYTADRSRLLSESGTFTISDEP